MKSFFILRPILFPIWKDLPKCILRGSRVPPLFIFKLPAGNGTTFEAVEHNGALDKEVSSVTGARM